VEIAAMRRAFLVVALVLGGCAFEPAGGVAPSDDDGTDAAATVDTDGAEVADDDAAPDFDADPSTTPDALVSFDAALPDAAVLPDAALPDAALPDAAAATDASLPIDAGMQPDAPGGPTTENACTNGDDDDHDGDTDCRDSDCPGCPGLLSCCGSGACALICL
jgi:hypothetical protein